MNECYYRNYEKYDWILFFELDEFIHLYNYTNIKLFLNEKKFKNCQIIYLNLIIHNDNDQLHYYYGSLFERFPNIVPKNKLSSLQVKMIIKGNIKNIVIRTTASCTLKSNNDTLSKCNGFGERVNQDGFSTKKTDYKFYYLDHFFFVNQHKNLLIN